MLEREGAQIGSLQCALIKLTPRAARRSKFGVGTNGLPSGRKGMSLRSSTMMNKTLGRSLAFTELIIGGNEIPNANKNTRLAVTPFSHRLTPLELEVKNLYQMDRMK